MASSKKETIRETALALIKATPEGIRYKDLHQAVCGRLLDVAPNTIASELHSLRHMLPPGSVVKGLYRHINSEP